MSNADNGELAVKKTIEHYGQLDVLVNNAGVFLKSPAKETASYETYKKVMGINIDATVRASLTAIEHLRKTKGNMVFVSSVASVKPALYGYAYCMSKAAMSSFAKCLAIDLAPEVRVNIVSPGPVATPIFEAVGLTQQMAEVVMACTTLQERVGRSDEIAKAIAFLASDDSSYVNGHELFIDGGYLIKPSNMNVDSKVIAHRGNEAAKPAQR